MSLIELFGIKENLLASSTESSSVLELPDIESGIYFIKAFDQNNELVETAKAIKL